MRAKHFEWKYQSTEVDTALDERAMDKGTGCFPKSVSTPLYAISSLKKKKKKPIERVNKVPSSSGLSGLLKESHSTFWDKLVTFQCICLESSSFSQCRMPLGKHCFQGLADSQKAQTLLLRTGWGEEHNNYDRNNHHLLTELLL